MSKLIGLPLVLIGFAAFLDDPAPSPAAAEREIRGVLSKQVEAWNSGDIPGFMAGYLKSETLRFASGDDVTFGWQQTLDRYEQSYDDRAKMGSLAFTELKVLVLSDEYAEVFGRWKLTRSEDVGDAMGRFTLLMKQTKDGWRVFHDHTSAARKKED